MSKGTIYVPSHMASGHFVPQNKTVNEPLPDVDTR